MKRNKTSGHETNRGRFFAIDHTIWPKVCAAGLNPAVAFLVLASWTDRDNRTTTASVNAIEKATMISRTRAGAALDALAAAGLVVSVRARNRTSPERRLAASENPVWVWLPNELVRGAAGEVPPLELLRQTGHVDALMLLTDMYALTHLDEDGSLHWSHLRAEYSSKSFGNRGQNALMTFEPTGKLMASGKLVTSFRARDKNTDAFWPAVNLLSSLGLIHTVRLLVDGLDQNGELISPCPAEDDSNATSGEVEVGYAIRRLGEALLDTDQRNWLTEKARCSAMEIVPVPAHRAAACHMVEAYRTRYRAKTFATAKWLARDAKWLKIAEKLNEAAEALETGTAKGTRAA